jgi:hypothetical protein
MNAMFRIFFIITLGLQNKLLQDVVVPSDKTAVKDVRKGTTDHVTVHRPDLQSSPTAIIGVTLSTCNLTAALMKGAK